MLLCDCVARGLLQPLLGRDGVRTKKGAGRTPDKAGSTTHVGGTLAMEPGKGVGGGYCGGVGGVHVFSQLKDILL